MREDDLYESSWEEVTRETFSATWSEEVAAARQTVDSETIRLATGLLLPIWSALPSDHLAVNRIVDGEGRSWLGRLVFDDHVPQLFTRLGIDRTETVSPDAVVKAVSAGRSIDVSQPFPLTIKRSIVKGSTSITRVGCPPHRPPRPEPPVCYP